jgi:hypothetical protein
MNAQIKPKKSPDKRNTPETTLVFLDSREIRPSVQHNFSPYSKEPEEAMIADLLPGERRDR